MNSHDFNFDGGEYLTKLGASWFTSFSYFYLVDRTHNNWRKFNRCALYWQTTKYHLFWLQKVVEMDEKRLATNKIGLTGVQVKELALKTLKKYEFLIENNAINNGIINYSKIDSIY